MAKRSNLLERFLGEKQAAAATEAVEALDAALENAGIEHKELDAVKMDADAFASAIVDVMKSDLTEDDKRAAVVEAIKDLMPTDHVSEAEKAGKMDKTDEEMADEETPEEDASEDNEDDDKGKMKKEFDGLEVVAKMIDDIGVVAEAQLEIESQFKQFEARLEDLTALAERVKALETVVTKTLKATPKRASSAEETIVKGDTSAMDEAMKDYEIDPIFGKVLKQQGA